MAIPYLLFNQIRQYKCFTSLFPVAGSSLKPLPSENVIKLLQKNRKSHIKVIDSYIEKMHYTCYRDTKVPITNLLSAFRMRPHIYSQR